MAPRERHTLTVRLPWRTHTMVYAVARVRGVTMSAVVEAALERYFSRRVP